MLKPQRHRARAPALPAETHSDLVATLFGTVGSFLAGIVGASIVPVVAFARTHDNVFVGCFAVLFGLALLRIGVFIGYRCNRKWGLGVSARTWDVLYGVGAISFMTAVGMIAAFLFQLTDDQITRLYAVVIAIGCAGALAARNAARPVIVYGQVLGVCGPLAIVMFAQPGAWYTGLGVMMILIIVSVKSTTRFLNQVIVAALLETRERRAAADALGIAKEAAEAASNAKSAFLATMSHEIRTPLNGVLGMAQAMAGGELSAEQRERLQVIQAAGQALLTVLNDVLDISKIESGAIELEDGIVDFDQIASTARSTFSSLAREKGLRLNATVEPEAQGLWRGDPARLRQILHNLVGNAVKFTDAGSVAICVGVEGGRVVVSVTDTGPGIAPERQGQIFDRFAQADASTTRRYGGTGLGLAICRELATLMGGQISVRSAPGEGACFTVRLPLKRVERAVAHKTASPDPADAPTPREQLRILAAEDNPTNQLVLQTLLSQFGLEAHIVENGEAAVEAWETGDWDVILMDVQMPVMDGPTATRIIRERERRSGLTRTPILALTANAMSHQAEEYRRVGMDGLVPKPINIGELIGAIEAAVAATAEQAPAVLQAKAG